MQTRRETLKQSAVVAGLLASAGFPQFAHAGRGFVQHPGQHFFARGQAVARYG